MAPVPDGANAENGPSGIPHVLTCDAYEEKDIRGRSPGRDIWRRIEQNQDERYHKPPEALIVVSHAESVEARPALPDLFLDFKKALALPTALLYQGAQEGAMERVAIVPPIYLRDLIHRF